MIKKVKGGYKVFSEKGRNMGGPHKTREEATKRLRQVEYFKHKKGWRPAMTGSAPESLRRSGAERQESSAAVSPDAISCGSLAVQSSRTRR